MLHGHPTLKSQAVQESAAAASEASGLVELVLVKQVKAVLLSETSLARPLVSQGRGGLGLHDGQSGWACEDEEEGRAEGGGEGEGGVSGQRSPRLSVRVQSSRCAFCLRENLDATNQA